MHLNEDFLRIDQDWIDETRFNPIITDFSRHALPIVRYRLNDVLQVRTTPCPCGSPHLALERIVGRSDDVLVFEGVNIYPDLLTRRIAVATDAYLKYTIEQVAPMELVVSIEAGEADFQHLCGQFEAAIRKLLEEQGVKEVKISFRSGVQHTVGDKVRKIRRLV